MMKKAIIVTIALSFLCLFGCEKTETVIYTTEDGKKTSDITEIEGKASYEVIGNQEVSIEANKLHEQARIAGQAGDYEKAISLLNKAISISPNWAYPYYDLAYTYLLIGSNAKALEMYRKVDKLEPKGFFTTKTAIWCLEREKDNTFPEGLYLSYLYLEWVEPEKKLNIINGIITKIPAFAPAWKEKALLVDDDKEKRIIIDKALDLNPDPGIYGILILNKASLLYGLGKKREAIDMITKLINNKNTTTGISVMAKESLKSFKL